MSSTRTSSGLSTRLTAMKRISSARSGDATAGRPLCGRSSRSSSSLMPGSGRLRGVTRRTTDHGGERAAGLSADLDPLLEPLVVELQDLGGRVVGTEELD